MLSQSKNNLSLGCGKGMESRNISITKFQLFFLLIQSQIGIGLLSLPNVVQASAKGDGWLSTLVAGGFIQLILIMYWLLLKRFPNTSYPQITKRILGSYLGKLVNLIIYIYFILTCSLSTLLFVKIINNWLLPLTPSWILGFMIIASSIYLAISDLRIIARFYVLTSLLIIFLILTSLLTFTLPKDFQFILPIGETGMKNILLGSNNSLYSMIGFEQLLLIYPFVLQRERGVLKTVSYANVFTTCFYTYFTFICLINFSPKQIQQIREPVIYLFRGLSYDMIERLDLIILSIWTVSMTTTVIIYLFLASKTINQSKKSHAKIVFINGLLVFLITLFPYEENMIKQMNKYLSYLTYGVIIFLPFVLLCLSLLLGKKEIKRVEEQS
ncbi:MAG: GerAB/ArcD/ProY family transporter [Bacillota bacterium]